MPSDTSLPSNHSIPQGLPSVNPPSGRFILQMFLIPGLIVAGLVAVLAFGGLIWVGHSTPESFLARLDNPNPDIRWRAATELAQVLKRPESLELASDPDFALDIAWRLHKANEELAKAEENTKKELGQSLKTIGADKSLNSEARQQKENEAALAAWRKLRPQRDLVVFLMGCVSDFTVPVGVPVLADIARLNNGAEIKSMALRKREAVWALANLGNSMNSHFFGKDPSDSIKVLTEQQKSAILDRLAKAASGDDERAAMARYAVGVLQKKVPSGVDKVLAECANHEDIFLRSAVGIALNFWDGDEVEPTLLRLARDQGKGRLIVDTDD